jgi:hypothetical protein
MGILDKKTRFIDLVITQEGKRQIAAGKLRAEYASLSDSNAFYDKGEFDDVQNRIYFEVMEKPENSIVLEKDDSGRLFPFDFSPTDSIVGNNIFVSEVEENVLVLKAATGSQFASTEASIISASLRHFKNNYLIGTYDQVGVDTFKVEPKEITYTIDNQTPFGRNPRLETINVDNAEPFFMDPKLSHLPNFKYLPPKNTDGSNYGTYEDIRNTSQETWQDIKERLQYDVNNDVNETVYSDNLRENYFGNLGKESRKLLIDGELPVPPTTNKLVSKLRFLETSANNNLVMQMFEDSNGSLMTKLDIVDAGLFFDNSSNLDNSAKRVFYIGKVYYDTYDTPTFINMFTMVME